MFSTNVDTRMDYTPGDTILIQNIVSQLKSQGVFDQFRKECISDVDTKPAYQNLCHRVDGRVEAYLSDIKWAPGLNKNQLRENIRKHVNECSFVDSGISRIVDQLVNPRINTVLVPKVEDIVYSYLGIERPENEQFKNNRSASEKTDSYTKHQKNEDENLNVGVVPKNERLVSSFNQHVKLSSNEDVPSNSKNEMERTPTLSYSTQSMSLSTINACSDIDSDEDDMSPPFEPLKSDGESGGELDYSMELSDTKDDVKSEQSVNVKLDTDCLKSESSESAKVDDNSDKIFRNLERICGEESMDSATSSCTDKMSSRKPSSSLDLPNTPTINYETDESQDSHFRKSTRRESVQNEICVPDTSSMDSFVEKILEDERESPNNLADDDCFAAKTINKEEKEQGDAVPNKKNANEIKLSDSKDSKKNHRHSDSKKDKDRKSEKDRKSNKDKYKDRSNHESKSQISKDGHNRDRKDSDKNKHGEKLLKENDPKHRDSSKPSTSSNKNRSSSSRSKTDDSKDDRKKKSTSSKHDSEKDRERSKHRKEESNDVKKNKTQCNTDNKKKKTDRRSSDRDGNGPPSSSHSSSHRSSTKTDKEKHRHSSSSSSSSSHKTKKNVETKDSDRTADALFDTMMLVTGSANVASDTLIASSDMNVNNASNILELLNDSSEDSSSEKKKDLSNEEIDRTLIPRQPSVNDNPTLVNDRIPDESSNHTDSKSKTNKVDSRHRLLNGSCTPNQVQNHYFTADSDCNVDSKNEDSNDEKHQKLNLEAYSENMKVNGLLKDASGSKMNSQDTEKVHGTRIHGCDPAVRAVSRDCSLEEADEVRYFEHAELNTDFINFVAKRVKESEELYLENFSIHLKCPERYDNILRDNLGAIVRRRCCKSETMSSPFKYNSEIIDNKIGNEKGIMMRIKKSIPEKELFPLPFGIDYLNNLPEETVSELRGTFSINISTNSNKTVLAKRKTLGLKRRLSNQAKVTNPKIAKLNHTDEIKAVDSKNCNSVMRCSENVQKERVDVGSYESFDGHQISHTLAPDSQTSLDPNHSFVHSLEPPPPKIPKVISKEQKRKQFYYDANDLYKPRPSFLLSSRRSRGLDPNNA